MKKSILTCFIFGSLATGCFAQFKTRIYNLYAGFPMSMKIDYNSVRSNAKETVFGMNVCVGNKHINTVAEYNWHSVDVSKTYMTPVKKINVHELMIGLRYYPARPTFIAGNMGIRLIAGGSVGWDLDLIGRSQYFIGLAFTGIRVPSGLFIQFTHYKISEPVQGYEIIPYWGIRLGFVIGPAG